MNVANSETLPQIAWNDLPTIQQAIQTSAQIVRAPLLRTPDQWANEHRMLPLEVQNLAVAKQSHALHDPHCQSLYRATLQKSHCGDGQSDG